MLADVSHVSVAQISQHGPSFPTFPSSSSADANTLPDRNKHPLACRACHDYLSHLGEAGHFPRDPPTWAQLQLAMREAKRERDIMDAFFDGRREGHRLEKENSAIRMSQIEEERDRTLALLKKCQADLLHAEQELFETILGVRAALAESGEPYLSSISREIGVRIQQVEVERDAALGLLEESKGELRRTQEKLFRALQELRFPSEPTTDVCQAVTKETVLHQTQEKVFRALQELKSHPSQVVSKEVLLQQTQDKLFQALQELRPPPKSDPDPSLKDGASSTSSDSVSPTSTMVDGSPPLAANSPTTKVPILAPMPLVPACAPVIQAEVPNLRDLQDLMEEASVPGNSTALAQVSEIFTQARATPEVQRNILQKYVFRYWTPPSHPPLIQMPATQDHIYVDASLWGIGFVMNGRWLAWKLKDGWTSTAGRDNNWSEMLAVELGLRAAIAAGYHNTALTIHSDNTGVVKALQTGTTKNTEHSVILRAILMLAQVAAIQIDARWISTKDNPADNPSRGIFPSSIYSFQHSPPIPKHLAEHVDRILVCD